MDIERVGVVGCGLMGSGIAEVCARAGLDVVVREVDAGAAEAGLARITSSLERARARRASSPRTTATRRSPACGSRPISATWPTVSSSSRPWSRTRQLKAEVFTLARQGGRGRRRDPRSNTSSIPIMKLGHGDAAGPSR